MPTAAWHCYFSHTASYSLSHSLYRVLSHSLTPICSFSLILSHSLWFSFCLPFSIILSHSVSFFLILVLILHNIWDMYLENTLYGIPTRDMCMANTYMELKCETCIWQRHYMRRLYGTYVWQIPIWDIYEGHVFDNCITWDTYMYMGHVCDKYLYGTRMWYSLCIWKIHYIGQLKGTCVWKIFIWDTYVGQVFFKYIIWDTYIGRTYVWQIPIWDTYEGNVFGNYII